MRINPVCLNNYYKKDAITKQSPNFEGKFVNARNAISVACNASLANVVANYTGVWDLLFSNPSFTYAMISLGTLFLTGLSGFIKESPIKLEEQIEFKESKTIEEAEAFAKEKFKIQNFKVEDLEVANWVNEGLTNISNFFKGQVFMPKTIKYAPFHTDKSIAHYAYGSDEIHIHQNVVERDAQEFPLLMKFPTAIELIKEFPFGTKHNEFLEMLEAYKKNPDSFSKIERSHLYLFYGRYLNFIANNDDNLLRKIDAKLNSKHLQEDEFGVFNYNKFHVLYHEMMHCFDIKSTPFYKYFFFKFKNSIKDLNLQEQSKLNSKEFCAEWFSSIINGDNPTQKIKDILKKRTNIKLNL